MIKSPYKLNCIGNYMPYIDFTNDNKYFLPLNRSEMRLNEYGNDILPTNCSVNLLPETTGGLCSNFEKALFLNVDLKNTSLIVPIQGSEYYYNAPNYPPTASVQSESDYRLSYSFTEKTDTVCKVWNKFQDCAHTEDSCQYIGFIGEWAVSKTWHSQQYLSLIGSTVDYDYLLYDFNSVAIQLIDYENLNQCS